jgi:hypothetical protein
MATAITKMRYVIRFLFIPIKQNLAFAARNFYAALHVNFPKSHTKSNDLVVRDCFSRWPPERFSR